MAYTELRKFLVSDGYLKLQPDVFMRVEDSKRSCTKHQNRIKMYLPPTGEGEIKNYIHVIFISGRFCLWQNCDFVLPARPLTRSLQGKEC